LLAVVGTRESPPESSLLVSVGAVGVVVAGGLLRPPCGRLPLPPPWPPLPPPVGAALLPPPDPPGTEVDAS